MAKVIITKSLLKRLKKSFSQKELKDIFGLFESVGKQPKKGKSLAHVGGILIKELKYGKYRFYFITDGFTLKFASEDELSSLIIKFVKMSDKKDQQKVIEEVKNILTSFGFEGF